MVAAGAIVGFVRGMGYSKPSNFPPVVVSEFSFSSIADRRLAKSFYGLGAGASFSSFWKGTMRYDMIMGCPFWKDLIYIRLSARQIATDRPVLPMGTLPISSGELMA